MTQCINQPTCFSSDASSYSVIDLFSTTRPDLVLSTDISDPISDHCCVTVHLNLSTVPQTTNKPRSLILSDFQHADWPDLREPLSAAPLFEAIQGTLDVDPAQSAWQGVFLEILNRYVPMKAITIRLKNKIWTISSLHKLSRQKHRPFAAAKRSGITEAWQAYQRARNECNIAFNKAKTAYMQRQQDKRTTLADGSSAWWRKAKTPARITTPAEPISDMTNDGHTVSNETEKSFWQASLQSNEQLHQPT